MASAPATGGVAAAAAAHPAADAPAVVSAGSATTPTAEAAPALLPETELKAPDRVVEWVPPTVTWDAAKPAPAFYDWREVFPFLEFLPKFTPVILAELTKATRWFDWCVRNGTRRLLRRVHFTPAGAAAATPTRPSGGSKWWSPSIQPEYRCHTEWRTLHRFTCSPARSTHLATQPTHLPPPPRPRSRPLLQARDGPVVAGGGHELEGVPVSAHVSGH